VSWCPIRHRRDRLFFQPWPCAIHIEFEAEAERVADAWGPKKEEN
jgi:hypothetical protein